MIGGYVPTKDVFDRVRLNNVKYFQNLVKYY